MTRQGKADPESPKAVFDDARMDVLIGRLLHVGVLLASAIVFVGGVLYLRAHGSSPVNYRQFRSEPEQLRQIHDLARGVVRGDPASLIQLGVLILIATPVARVVFASVAFAVERDWLYVMIGLAVLCILLAGLFRIG